MINRSIEAMIGRYDSGSFTFLFEVFNSSRFLFLPLGITKIILLYFILGWLPLALLSSDDLLFSDQSIVFAFVTTLICKSNIMVCLHNRGRGIFCCLLYQVITRERENSSFSINGIKRSYQKLAPKIQYHQN